MRFLRGSAESIRAVLTAGSHIGDAPSSLNPEQLVLFQAHTRRSFAAVVDQALADAADLMLIAGGLFARSEPGLEDIRFASQCLKRAREAGVVIVALDEADEAATDGTGIAFLEELGLLAAVRPGGPMHTRTVQVAGLTLEIGSASAMNHIEPAADRGLLRIALTIDAEALESREMAADVIVLGNRPDPGQRRLGDALVLCPGWSAPSVTERRAESGFAIIDLDREGVVGAEFRELAGVAPVVVSFSAADLVDRDPAAAIRERLATLIGEAPLVALEFEGEFSRELWHCCRVGDLSRRASAAGTLVHVDLAQLHVSSGPAEAQPTRSFMVEVRRAAEQLSGSPDGDADTMARARRAVVDGFRRRAGSHAA